MRCENGPLVAHTRKETVDGEAVLGAPREGLLVGVGIRHTRLGDGLYELVLAHVKGYGSLLGLPRALVRAKRYRSRLPRRVRVEAPGSHQVVGERHRPAAGRKAVPFEGEVDQVRSHYTDALQVPGGRGIAHPVLAPHGDGVTYEPTPVGRSEQLVGCPHHVLCANSSHLSSPFLSSCLHLKRC